MIYPEIISPYDTSLKFPDVENALEEPNGLLAIGGDLSPERLLQAYRHGIFPWFNYDQPILWWSPNPRMVLYPDELHVSRSLQKTLRNNGFSVTYDKAFKQVMFNCSLPRTKQQETWISPPMLEAYTTLHEMGKAHSFEAWQNGELVGGLYGISIGCVFFGESMFSFETNASKIAFVTAVNFLKQWGYELIDCQVETEHLASLGARNIPREAFLVALHKLIDRPASATAWNIENQVK